MKENDLQTHINSNLKMWINVVIYKIFTLYEGEGTFQEMNWESSSYPQNYVRFLLIKLSPLEVT
jgi:hypothetical protein